MRENEKKAFLIIMTLNLIIIGIGFLILDSKLPNDLDFVCVEYEQKEVVALAYNNESNNCSSNTGNYYITKINQSTGKCLNYKVMDK